MAFNVSSNTSRIVSDAVTIQDLLDDPDTLGPDITILFETNRPEGRAATLLRDGRGDWLYLAYNNQFVKRIRDSIDAGRGDSSADRTFVPAPAGTTISLTWTQG